MNTEFTGIIFDSLIVCGWALIANELGKVNSAMHRLKEDHFDLQVTFSKIMDVVEHNKHEIEKFRRVP